MVKVNKKDTRTTQLTGAVEMQHWQHSLSYIYIGICTTQIGKIFAANHVFLQNHRLFTINMKM